MNTSIRLRAALTALALFASGTLWGAGFLEREIYFSEADIQTQVEKSGTMQKSYGNGLVVVSLIEPPRIFLGTPEGRATLSARINVSLLGSPPVPVAFEGTSGIRYDDNAKAFFLENPVAHSVQSQAIGRESEPMARQAVTQLMSNYFRAKPVYILREDGTAQEKAARWLLRSIRIEPGRVVAILSPV
ncbi:DUF1439 domain-containing protein [Ferribacterium limneticum]|uniref:DUF1439 domain-containing protein n=1 Tax=Ferribacterium limneticum TaxID=76259 RepID=UPI001CFB0DD4|nr:DUF1439 domain-containing protein [Ferribacterium limneticum]UCV19257.1 DUF1439 domain-containing protein [Ferribacterium limneticum]